jgi:hypothetical protein
MLRTPTAPRRVASAARTTPAIRTALVVALTALVLLVAALAYVVSFEAIRAFAIQTAAFPPALAWAAPLLVDSFTTAATLVILWRYLRGEPFFAAWYAWALVALATAVSVALNVAHAPPTLAARLFAALPPVALLGAVELLMSVARAGLPRTPAEAIDLADIDDRAATALDRTPGSNGQAPPAVLPHTGPHDRTSNGMAPHADPREQVRALVTRERHGGPPVTVAEVIAATGRSRRRAYELLRAARTP